MKKTILSNRFVNLVLGSTMFLALSSNAQATTVSCFTKYFFDRPMTLSFDLSPQSLQVNNLEVKFDQVTQKLDGRTFVGTIVGPKSKYVGMVKFNFHLFSNDGFSVTLIFPPELNGKFTALAVARDGHGGSNHKLVCQAK